MFKQWRPYTRVREQNDSKTWIKRCLTGLSAEQRTPLSREKQKLFDQIPQDGCWINLPVETQKEYLGKSLKEILRYIDLTEDEFKLICNRFTNKKIFKKNSDGSLQHDNLENLMKLNHDNVK